MLISKASCSLWIVILAITSMCEGSSALTIYRFGGDPEQLPLEKLDNPDDVTFIPIAWTDPVDEDLGGEVLQVDLRGGTINALRYEPDENIALTAADRGGGARAGTAQLDFQKAVDADLSTAWIPIQYLCAECDPTRVAGCNCGAFGEADYLAITPWTFGLGGFFNLDRVRIVSGLEDEASIMRNFKIHVASTSQVYTEIADVRDNKRQVLDVEIPPGDRVDFVRVYYSEHGREWSVAEIEIYAAGFAEKTSYVSEIIPFDQPFAWGELSWGGSVDSGAEVRIHTRSGESVEQSTYWRYTARGNKVQLEGDDTATQYRRLKQGEKAGTTYNLDEWTFWSAPYDFADSSGTPVVSTGPRQFFQFKIDIIPFNESGGEVEFLEFRTSEPLASELIGEVFPSQVTIAEPSSFTYFLQPLFGAEATGFDGLEMMSSSIINAVTALRIGEIDVPLDQEDVIPLDADGQQMASFPAHGFELNFAGRRLAPVDSGTPVEVDFDARVLRSGATFEVRVLDSNQPLAVRQRVEEGDANNLIEGNSISVATTPSAESLLQATMTKIFTPNDDGTNDAAIVSYDLLEIIGASEVTIEISDLSGRVVAEVYSGKDAIGHYEREWRGLDDRGDVVPPGAYLYRINVDTDRPEKVTQTGVVNVAY
jgi:hypothetical protein